MFIATMKKYVKLLFWIILMIIIFTTYIILLNSFNFWMIHTDMPSPDSTPREWNYKLIFTSFKPSENGYSVLVDLDSLILTLYEDEQEIKSWPVSGGSKENPSPTGSWVVTQVEHWGDSFGGSWIALNVPWGKYGIHGTVEPWAVGDINISHGCIRMINDDVAELKAYMTKDVHVFIKYDTIPFRVLKDGKIGSDVLKLQVMLKELGYFKKAPDGCFGKSTFRAVCQFQEDEKIKVDGIVGLESWKLLHNHMSKLRK